MYCDTTMRATEVCDTYTVALSPCPVREPFENMNLGQVNQKLFDGVCGNVIPGKGGLFRVINNWMNAALDRTHRTGLFNLHLQ
jgi:hypothetical protein